MRRGCGELLMELRRHYTLVLWSVSSRRYVEKALDAGLRGFFERTYTWDDHPCRWKDVRALGVDWLVDDSDHHRAAATASGVAADRYVVVPAYGSPEDDADPLSSSTRTQHGAMAFSARAWLIHGNSGDGVVIRRGKGASDGRARAPSRRRRTLRR